VERQKNEACTDLDMLNRLKLLSAFSAVALRELANSLHSANFKKREIILPEERLAAGVHILLRGVAKITCLNRCGQRVTVALLAPGPIPEFPSLPVRRWQVRCEAHSDCRVGSLGWDQFDVITRAEPQYALRRFHESNLMPWYRFFAAGLDLRERLVTTLLQLCSNFGVIESRGTLLRVFLSHKDLADLVGASRPRVTEHLAELEREHLLIRQGRQLIVRLNKIENSSSAPRPDTNDPFANASAEPTGLKQDRFYGAGSLAQVAYLKPLICERSASPVYRPADNSIAVDASTRDRDQVEGTVGSSGGESGAGA
jgi:CRP-like cAMP-binding protein